MSNESYKATKANRDAKKKGMPPTVSQKLDPKFNKVKGFSGGSGDNPFRTVDSAITAAVMPAIVKRDGKHIRNRGAGHIVDAYKRVEAKRPKKKK